MSTQYIYNKETKKAEVCSKSIDYKFGTEYESGGAGCISTVEDYIKFLEALRIGDIILKSETIELMSTNQLTKEQGKAYWKENSGYGLGVRCAMAKGEATDFGWGGAAGSFPLIDRKHNLTFFYAQHVLLSDHSVRNDRMREWFLNDLCAEI